MKTIAQWTTYRTRFLVKAKKLNYSLTFTDSLGREHHGTKGDYLVESSDGGLRICPRQIFEDVYVPMAEQQAEQCLADAAVWKPNSLPPAKSLSRRRAKRSSFEVFPPFPGEYPPPCRDARPTAGVRFL